MSSAAAAPAAELGGQVRDDVAEEVLGDEDVVVEGVLEEPHADRVDVGVPELDVGVALGDLAGRVEHEAAGLAEDVRLLDAGDGLPAVFAGGVEGGRAASGGGR